MNRVTPVDDQNKSKQVYHQLDHPHHFLFGQLSENLCDINLMLSSQVCSQVVYAYRNVNACSDPFASHSEPSGKYCLSNILNWLQQTCMCRLMYS